MRKIRFESRTQVGFLLAWIFVTAIKLVVAARLPLFVDEAFYWQEGRHLAWAYSDLPGLTAWLCRVGTSLGGEHVLALRLPFLLIGAAIPWLLANICAREFGAANGWGAGLLAVLMPLPATLGIMALPDVPMALATLLCLDAVARLLRATETRALLELALGLCIGELSHYRFAGVIAVGLIALLMLRPGRMLLRDPRVGLAFGIGLIAWLPLVLWNFHNADTGLRFQLLERNPWAFHFTGAEFIAIQGAVATPLLFWAMAQAAWRARRPGESETWRWFALFGGGSTLAYFLLGFFADAERVSFHWTLPGFLALIIALPPAWCRWKPGWRRVAWICAGLGTALTLGYYLLLSSASWRASQAGSKYYPYNFSGWNELARAVHDELAQSPQARVLADNFKIGAELGFALDDADIAVLDHPLNRKHGRAPQLALWHLASDGSRDAPVLLVASSSDVKFRALVDYYQGLCARVGPLPPPRVVNLDHGGQRYLLFHLPAQRGDGACVAPVQAYIDSPQQDATVSAKFAVAGWAIKDVAGVRGVTVTLDGKPVADAVYGDVDDLPLSFYAGKSRDPRILQDVTPHVGFHASVDASDFAPGTHWLGLVVHGADGSDETWEERAIVLSN